MVKGGEAGSEWRRRNMGMGVGKEGRERGILFKRKSGREGRCLDDLRAVLLRNNTEKCKNAPLCAFFGACFRCILAAEKTIEMDEKSLLPVRVQSRKMEVVQLVGS